jgi:hypothetical protein
MGIFRKQSMRLRREDWSSPLELAEEIYAILNSDEPIEIDGRVIINNDGDSTPLTINQYGGDGDIIEISRRDEPPVQFPELPPLEFDGPGDFTVTIIDESGEVSTDTTQDGSTPSPQPRPDSGGGGGFPGKVVSGGPGVSYEVDVYESGLSAAPTRRTVRQLQIHESESVPADTWALVGKVGEEYFMQVPVWLEG